MKKSKKMKVLALLLTACVVLMLTGCEASSTSTSTTTITTSKTDADGNTTTNTTTAEVGTSVGTNGVSTTVQTTTENSTDADGNTTTNTTTSEVGASLGKAGVTTTSQTTTETTTTPSGGEPSFTAEDLRAAWQERYSGGGKGTSKAGETIYLAFDDADSFSQAVLMDVDADGKGSFSLEGEVSWDDENDCWILYDDELDRSIAFVIDGGGEDDTYTLRFVGDGDEAVMTPMDLDTLFDEMIAVWKNSTSNAA